MALVETGKNEQMASGLGGPSGALMALFGREWAE
jgi:hypothetical protein